MHAVDFIRGFVSTLQDNFVYESFSKQNSYKLIIKELTQRERKVFYQMITNPHAHDSKVRRSLALKIALLQNQLENSTQEPFAPQRKAGLLESLCRGIRNIFNDRLGSHKLLDALINTPHVVPLSSPSLDELCLVEVREPIRIVEGQKKLKNYEKCLGEGYTTRVYEHARKPHWAVKAIHPREGVREYMIGALLDHPNLAKTHKMYIEEGKEQTKACIVMEKIEGKSILDFRNLIPPALIIELLKQAKECCAYLFREDVSWRDVNPGNIYIDKSQNLKLLDFGQWEEIKDPSMRGKILLLGAMEMIGYILGSSQYEEDQNEFIFPESFFETKVDFIYNVYSRDSVGYDFYDEKSWMQFIINQLSEKTDDQIEEFLTHYFDCVIEKIDSHIRNNLVC